MWIPHFCPLSLSMKNKPQKGKEKKSCCDSYCSTRRDDRICSRTNTWWLSWTRRKRTQPRCSSSCSPSESRSRGRSSVHPSLDLLWCPSSTLDVCRLHSMLKEKIGPCIYIKEKKDMRNESECSFLNCKRVSFWFRTTHINTKQSWDHQPRISIHINWERKISAKSTMPKFESFLDEGFLSTFLGMNPGLTRGCLQNN